MKSKTTAALLAFFLGGLGVHRFYLGQPLLGIIYLLLCWTLIPAIIGLIDFIVLVTYSDEKFDRKYNQRSNSQKTENFIQQTEPRSQSKNFKPTVAELAFPDRVDAIVWHLNAIDKGFRNKDFELVNLSYAKLIESIRQENVNEKGVYSDNLESVRSEYKEFREAYGFEYPQEFLPLSERKKENSKSDEIVNISSHTEGNTTTMIIDLNEEELLRRIQEGNFNQDEYEETEFIDDITGFYGTEEYSSNKKFAVVFADGHYENDKWKKGQFAVLKDKKLLFKKKIERPNDCQISDNGVSICCDWLNSDDLEGRFIAFNTTGKEIFSRKTSANLGSCGISNDGKIAVFETYNSDTVDSDQLFIVDLEKGEVINHFERPTSFNSVAIDTLKNTIKLIDNKQFSYEIDYSGNQLNREEYESNILQKGSIYDKLWLYSEKSEEDKFSSKGYLSLLLDATEDKDSQYSYGLDRLYRMIGEYYEANNDNTKTIEYWEKAIEINPKVGVKRKLDKLKK